MLCSICLLADISQVFLNVLYKSLYDVDDGIQIYSYTFLLNVLVTLSFWYIFINTFFFNIYKPSWGRVQKCLKSEAEYITFHLFFLFHGHLLFC